MPMCLRENCGKAASSAAVDVDEPSCGVRHGERSEPMCSEERAVHVLTSSDGARRPPRRAALVCLQVAMLRNVHKLFCFFLLTSLVKGKYLPLQL